MPTRAKLIQLIHVAKRELGLDDTAYREAIASVAKGKSSCAQLLDRELEALLASFKSAGFKRRTNPHQKRRLSPPSEAPVKTAEIRKIRAIWIAMHGHEFVNDGSETALNAYIKRMTARLNDGVGVDEVGWLNDWMAAKVLEALKAWHRRVMIEAMMEAKQRIPVNERTGRPAGYDAVLSAYEEHRGGAQ